MNEYLMTQAWMTDHAAFNEHIDVALLAPWVKVSEDIFVRGLIGIDQYNRLVSGIVAGDLSSDELKLIELILPAEAYDILDRAIPFVSIQVRGSGVVSVANSHITAASDQQVNSLLQRARSISNYYADLVIKYICDNPSKYPLINNQQDPHQITKVRKNSGFYFDSDDNCCCSKNCNC